MELVLALAVLAAVFWFFWSAKRKSAAPEAQAGVSRPPETRPGEPGAFGRWKITLGKRRRYRPVVGESFRQEELSRICGGKCEDGYRDLFAAILLPENNPHDANAVAVQIQGRPVGFLAKQDAAEFRSILQEHAGSVGPVDCQAIIVGGWKRTDDEGDFGVKILTEWPPKFERA